MVDRITNEGPEKISREQSLSPLEHKLFGSTPPNMSIAGANALIDRASDGEGDAVRQLLSPIISGEGVDRSLIEKAREDRRRIGPHNIFGTTESFGDSFPLKDYTLYVCMGKLSDRGCQTTIEMSAFSIAV